MTASEFKVGDKVVFGRPNGEKTAGTVVKINRTRIKVRQDEARGHRSAGTVWSVPPSLCTRGGNGQGYGPPPTPTAPRPAPQADFAKAARQIGLPEDCLGKTFKHWGTTLTITGIRTSRWRYPVSVQGPQGGKYKMDVASVLNGLGQAAAPEKPARPESEIMTDILSTYNGLSPENLTCDGELGASEIRKRGVALRVQLLALETELGRRVSEDEAYRWHSQQITG